MVISEFIAELEKIKKEKGDLEVVIWDYKGFEYERACCYSLGIDIPWDRELAIIDIEGEI